MSTSFSHMALVQPPIFTITIESKKSTIQVKFQVTGVKSEPKDRKGLAADTPKTDKAGLQTPGPALFSLSYSACRKPTTCPELLLARAMV